MGLQQFRTDAFRCLSDVEIKPDPKLNLVTGRNASGKTSLLESIYYLGRGRSFRASGNRELIASDQSGFSLFGQVKNQSGTHKIGAQVGAGQRNLRIDGDNGTAADLARILPVQVIDPEIHQLVQGGPELRRKFLDWGVFHVKHAYLESWRKYHQALKQRNACLRSGAADSEVRLWDVPLVEHGEAVGQIRQEFLDQFLPIYSSIIGEFLSFDVICSYKRGWSAGEGLEQAVGQSFSRDRALSATQVGPHRADLTLQVDTRRARHRVSRGQQKMMAAALLIAQTRFVAVHSAAELVLLVDDPAAELDRDNRNRLFGMLQQMPAQMFVTALEPEDLPWADQAQMFHVEHGEVTSLL